MSAENAEKTKNKEEEIPTPDERIIANLYTASELLVRMTSAAEKTFKVQTEELKIMEEVKGIIEEFGRSAEKLKEIKSVIEYMDTLSKAVTAQQGNIDALITALGKFAEDHRQLKEIIKNRLGSDFKIGKKTSGDSGPTANQDAIVAYYSAAASTATFVAMIYLFFFGG